MSSEEKESYYLNKLRTFRWYDRIYIACILITMYAIYHAIEFYEQGKNGLFGINLALGIAIGILAIILGGGIITEWTDFIKSISVQEKGEDK